MPSAKLDQRVREAAQAAQDNGYTFWENAFDLAMDMATCCSDLETEDPDAIEESISRQGLLKKKQVGCAINIIP